VKLLPQVYMDDAQPAGTIIEFYNKVGCVLPAAAPVTRASLCANS
jgi:hypothetical protein